MQGEDPICDRIFQEENMKTMSRLKIGRYVLKTFQLLIPGIWIVFAFGCAQMIDYLPSPPESMSRIELKGEYDKDIPEKYIGQLRGASITSDWAIPYIFMSIGMHFESVGDEKRTIHFFDRAIDEFRTRKNFYGEGTATNRKVFALHEFGKIQEAFNVIKEKEREWKEPPMNAFVYHNYGHYYLMNGDYGKASDFFRKSFAVNPKYRDDFNLLMLRRDSELEIGISIILADYVPQMSRKYSMLDFNEAMIDAIRKHVDEGVAHLSEVLVLNQEIRKTTIGRFTPDLIFNIMESNVYNFLGLASGIKADWKQSHKYLAMSSDLARKADFRVGEIDSVFFLNQVYLLEKNVTDGQKAAERFNEMADRYRLPFYQVWAKYILSRYHAGFGNTAKAISILKETVGIIEQQRSGLMIDILKETYLYNRQAVYESLIDLLAREGDYKGALEIAERAKSRVLVDLLAGKDISRNADETSLLVQEEEANGQIMKIQRQMLMPAGESAARGLVEKLEKAQQHYRGVILKIRGENEELFSMVSVQVTDPAGVQDLLDQNTTLVDYFVMDKMLYVWVVNKERIHLERIRISREELRDLVSSFLAAITAKDKKKTHELSERLYDVILKPIIPFASGVRIGFIPHDSLYYLPFAALSHKGRFLVQDFAAFTLPNADIFKYVMGKQVSREMKILAFGNPDLGERELDLPYTATEVENIKKRIAQTTIFLRGDATKKRVKEMIDNFDIVHFATHGQYVPESPMNSSLLLTPDSRDDGRLTALEILKLHFKGRAVVLSACKTALGMSSTGTEIIGLNRSFLYAGSPSIISTLWSVDDMATASFMDDFYGYIEKNKDIADALRLSQLNMINKGYDPYFWAPFILTGRY
jgi:CHAT domain-containing protein